MKIKVHALRGLLKYFIVLKLFLKKQNRVLSNNYSFINNVMSTSVIFFSYKTVKKENGKYRDPMKLDFKFD